MTISLFTGTLFEILDTGFRRYDGSFADRHPGESRGPAAITEAG